MVKLVTRFTKAIGQFINFINFIMLTIRFQRVGRKNDPAFRIVLAERRSKPKSGEIEILGSYHPKTKETRLKVERISYWLSKGAKPSPTVWNLLVDQGAVTGKKISMVKQRVGAASSTG